MTDIVLFGAPKLENSPFFAFTMAVSFAEEVRNDRRLMRHAACNLALFLLLVAHGGLALWRGTSPCDAAAQLSAGAPASASVGLSDAAYRQVLDVMPVVTCDVVVLNAARNATLLCKRTNKPVQGVWYTLGGRLLKNESLAACAARKLRAELGLRVDPSRLRHAGSVEEVFPDSTFAGVNSHCVNAVFALVLTEAEEAARQRPGTLLDGQHSQARWFARADYDDQHEYVQAKLRLVVGTHKPASHKLK
jgi:colanic acid biosynthesis protein WcaH